MQITTSSDEESPLIENRVTYRPYPRTWTIIHTVGSTLVLAASEIFAELYFEGARQRDYNNDYNHYGEDVAPPPTHNERTRHATVTATETDAQRRSDQAYLVWLPAIICLGWLAYGVSRRLHYMIISHNQLPRGEPLATVENLTSRHSPSI